MFPASGVYQLANKKVLLWFSKKRVPGVLVWKEERVGDTPALEGKVNKMVGEGAVRG